MADHEGAEPRDARLPGELFRPTVEGSPSGARSPIDLAEALGSLDRATRDFTRRLGEGQRDVEKARMAGERAIREAAEAESDPSAEATAEGDLEPEVAVEAAPELESELEPEPTLEPVVRTESAEDAFDRRMRQAEEEAREYLDAAKRRADTLVTTMIGAVEQEADQIRRDTEDGIRARWHQVEVESTRQVENARRVATRIVSERQTRISKLSDGITGKAEALTLGMDDADRVRAQFETFVKALSEAADQIAKEPQEAAQLNGRRLEHPRHRAMAA